MRKALVIGINAYPGAELEGAVKDAECIAKLLRTHGNDDPNFDVEIHNDVLTRAALRALITKFYSSGADVALLYFAGHGFLNEHGGYIVTPDFQEYDEGIPMDDILRLANQSQIRNNIIILDCCNSGSFAKPTIDGTVTPIKEGISILTACRDNEPAKEINGHGVFTNLLINALEGGAADLRGHISPGGIYAYIDQALNAHEQRPVFKTNVTEFISLRKVTPQVSLHILRKLTTYFESEYTELALDPSYEETNNNDIVHEVKEPYADPDNVNIFKDLQKLQSVGLVVPVNEEHMYFAAMNSKACKLTTLGFHYWRLVKERRI